MPVIPYTWNGPMKKGNALDSFKQNHLTPGLGSDFRDLDLVAALQSPNADNIFRDLAITISERGVAVFRNQHLDNDTHKQVVDKIAIMSGRPKDNTLMTNALHPLYGDDPIVITLIPERVAERYGYKSSQKKRQNHAHEWHSDMSFEENPSDYSSLRLGEVPPTGGDTCYASCYELYDRLSEPFQKLFESLQVQWGDPHYVKAVATEGTYRGYRGSPANCDYSFDAVHPAVRTNPVTGWKAIFAGGMHCQSFVGLTEEENTQLMGMIEQLVIRNHDLQARVHWEAPGDISIWDNRAVKHIPTRDQTGKRKGYRVISAGEKPFLAPNGSTRQTDLDAEEEKAKALLEKATKAQETAKVNGANGHATDGNGMSEHLQGNGIAAH